MPFASADNLYPAVVRRAPGREGQWELGVALSDLVDHHGIPVARSDAPDQTNLNRRRLRITGQHDTTRIFLAVQKPQAFLKEPTRLAVSGEDDPGRVFADIRIRLYHRDGLLLSDDHPGGSRQ